MSLHTFHFQVSGLTVKGVGDVSLMERLLNSDTIRHQQKLSRVVRLLRDEFAFDGYMENGIEDLAMGKCAAPPPPYDFGLPGRCRIL